MSSDGTPDPYGAHRPDPPAGDTRIHWGLLAFFAGVAGFYLLSLVLTGLFSGRFAGATNSDLPMLGPIVLVAFAPNLLLGLAPLVGSWWRGDGLRADFGIVPRRHDVLVGLACGGFALLVAFVATLLLTAVYGPEQMARSPVSDLVRMAGQDTVWLVLIAVFVVIGAPLTEELILRGALWRALEHYRIPQGAILVLTALMFAFLHEEPMRTPALVLQGLAIGTARMVTGKTSASMIAHAANNLLPALVLLQAT